MRVLTEIEQQLYTIQHKWIPKHFYGSTRSFVERLKSEGGQILVNLFDSMNKHKDEYRRPYTENDFEVSVINPVINSDLGVTVLKINMPEPTAPLLCRTIYLAQTDSDERFCYTIELTDSGDYLLCGWSDGEDHVVFYLCSPIDESRIENTIVSLSCDLDNPLRRLNQKNQPIDVQAPIA